MERSEVEKLVTPENMVKLIDALLATGLVFDELSRQNNHLLPMIEKILKQTKHYTDKELKEAMVEYIIKRHPSRKKEREIIERVIDGYLEGIVVVVNQNDETAKVMYEEAKRNEIKEAIQTINSPNFVKSKAMTLTEQEAMAIQEKNKFTISLYNALNSMLDGSSTEELRTKGAMGELLADTMEQMKETKNIHTRLSLLRILVQAVPQQNTNNTLNFIQQTGMGAKETKEEDKDQKIVSFLEKLKQAKTINN